MRGAQRMSFCLRFSIQTDSFGDRARATDLTGYACDSSAMKIPGSVTARSVEDRTSSRRGIPTIFVVATRNAIVDRTTRVVLSSEQTLGVEISFQEIRANQRTVRFRFVALHFPLDPNFYPNFYRTYVRRSRHCAINLLSHALLSFSSFSDKRRIIYRNSAKKLGSDLDRFPKLRTLEEFQPRIERFRTIYRAVRTAFMGFFFSLFSIVSAFLPRYEKRVITPSD